MNDTVDSRQLKDFKASDYRGKEWTKADFEGKKAIVVCFLGTECPLAKLYSQRLVELEKEFQNQSVAWIAVDANDQDSLQEMGAHARKHNFEFPFLKDAGQIIADELGATRTPEVCVLDQDWKLRYRGRIDDQRGIGYTKNKPTETDLKNAVEALLQGREVASDQKPAEGCLIGRRRANVVASEITYCNQIARLLQKHCVSCHRDGDIGPMSLNRYEDVATWAEMILEVVGDDRMPPWHADPKHGHFSNERRLTEQEKQELRSWVQAGTPEGDRAQLPPELTFTEGWQLPREPDMVLNISPKPFRVKATGDVNYQYFKVDPELTEDKWVKAAELLPGNRAVVHHILVFVRKKGERGNLDGERGFLFGYVPGTRVAPMPKGMGKRIPKDSELIFQVHYTPIGTEQFDQSKFAMIFADPSEITHEVLTTSAVQLQLAIPPKDANYQTNATLPEELPECQLLSMSPHMHVRGKSFRYTALLPGGKKEILLDIPRYDFNWQTEYRLAEDKMLPAGTKIYCEASYDNSEKNLSNPNPNSWVHWGDQTYEEMMIGYFHVAVPRDSQATDGGKKPKRRANQDVSPQAIFLRLDRNKDGKLEGDEIPPRLKPVINQLDKNKDGILEKSEVPDR